MNWFLKLFGGRSIHVGTRVQTKDGLGTVTGGTLCVRLDKGRRAKNGSINTGMTYNIDKERITNA